MNNVYTIGKVSSMKEIVLKVNVAKNINPASVKKKKCSGEQRFDHYFHSKKETSFY